MKNILLFLLLFVLSINVLLAQITLDGTTSTATSDSAGITIINIATPNANGLSNNNYTDFNISSSGVVFNNSETGGDSQLTSNSITGNASITAGSEATLILNQVTSSNASTLSGRAEVVGGSGVGVIIANPNGITCAGCGFINASQVSLVAGTVDNSSLASGIPTFDTTNEGTIIFSGDVNIDGDLIVKTANTVSFNDGLITILGNATIDTNIYIQDGYTLDVANHLNILSTGEITVSADSSILAGDEINVSAESYLLNYGDIISDSLNFYFLGDGARLQNSGDISSDSLNISASGNSTGFNNGPEGIVNTNNFNARLTAGGLFVTAGTINTVTLDIEVDQSFSNKGGTIIANSLSVVGRNFSNEATSTIEADILKFTGIIPLSQFINEENSTIDVNSLDVRAIDIFENDNSTISSDSVQITIHNEAPGFSTGFSNTNNATIRANNLVLDSPTSQGQFDNVGGNIFADRLTLNVPLSTRAGDTTITYNQFRYFDDYLDNGNIEVTTLVLEDPILFFDSTRDFVWDAGKTLIVEGNADITANQFFNNGTIEFKNNLDLNLVGDFDYINHYGNATTTNEQDFRIGGDFIYDDDTTKFVWKAGDKLNVTKGVLVTTDSFDNAGNISAGSFIISTLGDFDYINHYGNTTAANLDFRIGGDFFYEGGGAFLWSDGDKLKVAGNVNINTSSSITNSGDIDVGMNINATADKFLNTSTGNITADTLTFVSLGDFDFGEDFVNNGVINATIKIESTNVFVFNDINKDFVLNDNFSISGNFFVTADNYLQNSDLNISGDIVIQVNGNATLESEASIQSNMLSIQAANFSNQGDITSDDLVVNVGNRFINTGSINVNNGFDLSVAGDFDYNDDYGNISAATLDFNVGGDFIYDDDTTNFVWNAGDSLTVLSDAAITANQFTNDGALDFRQKLTLNLAGDFDYNNYENTNTTAESLDFNVGGSFSYDDNTTNFVWNAGDSLIVIGDAAITANQFTNDGALDFRQKLTLNLTGDFDYINHYENTNTTAESLDFNVGGSFSYDDNTTNFVWNAGDNLTVTGDSAITANQFTNNGAIDFEGKLTLNLAGDFDYNDDYGNISAATLDFNVGGNFSYDDNTTNFVWNAGDSLTVLSDAAITATQFTNNGAIDFKQKLTLNLTGDFDYSNYENTNTSAESLDLDIGGNFSYDDNTTNFVWNAGDSLTVSGNASVIADSYTQLSDINVSGNVYIQVNKNASIDSGASIQSDLLSLQAVEFSNRGSVTSANVAASVDNFNNAINATVSTGNFATEVKNFNNSGTINVGNLGFAIDGSFDNEGSITATNSFNVSVENNFRNSGSINSPSLYVSAGNRVDNYGDLDAADFLIIEAQGDINNSDINNAANISSISLFINGYGNFTNDNSNIDIVGASVIHAGGEFSNSGNITAEALGIFANEVTNNGVIIVDYLDVSADTVNNTGDITADIFDITANSFTGNNINIR